MRSFVPIFSVHLASSAPTVMGASSQLRGPEGLRAHIAFLSQTPIPASERMDSFFRSQEGLTLTNQDGEGLSNQNGEGEWGLSHNQWELTDPIWMDPDHLPLHEAAEDGDRADMIALLANPNDNAKDSEMIMRMVNAKDSDGYAPLHLVAKRYVPDLELVNILVQHGADVNATVGGDSRDSGADVNATGGDSDSQEKNANYSYTPLHLAVKYSHQSPGLLNLLLEKPNIDVSRKDENGQTPLFMAAMIGNLEAVNVLVEHGADINAANKNGYTPLHAAAMAGNVEMLELLIEHGAIVNTVNSVNFGTTEGSNFTTEGQSEGSTSTSELPNGTSMKSPMTPLQIAAHNGHLDVVKVLIEHGADVHTKHPINGQTALHIAAGTNLQTGKLEVVNFLLEHGAQVGADVNAKDHKGQTPLHKAAMSSSSGSGKGNLQEDVMSETLEVVRALLKKNADRNMCDNQGKKPIDLARVDLPVSPVSVNSNNIANPVRNPVRTLLQDLSHVNLLAVKKLVRRDTVGLIQGYLI